MKNYKLLEVFWIDSSCNHDQTSEIEEPFEMKVVGYLIKDAKEYITLAFELCNQDYRNQLSIPKVCIKMITELKRDGIWSSDKYATGEVHYETKGKV